MRLSFAFLSAALLCACAQSAADAPIPEQWRAVAVQAIPVNFGDATLGQLRFRGGVELHSSDPVFGGLSDIEVLPGNRFISQSDDGEWFEGDLVLDADGALTGVANMRTAMMRDEQGHPFANKEGADSEDIAQLPDGRIAVSFEQTQTIRIYDLNRDGPFGAATPGPRLVGVERLPLNSGLEAMTALEDGTLVVGAEGGDQPTTPIWLAPLNAHSPVPVAAHFPLSGGFSLTSLDRMPNGDLVAMERFYAPVIGARARIVRVPVSELHASDAPMRVEQLAQLGPPHPVDNFEGVSAVRMPNGVTRLYIVSDDNFSRRQRTYIFAFDVIG
ncbi:MAG: esterase-like activity of phytase family protein [Proteobacteria bacterium]|nr:esterase-like activity of phytase family protein [Pseudomonadota bacterium]